MLIVFSLLVSCFHFGFTDVQSANVYDLIEFANPRHQHEYAEIKKHPIPSDAILIPGVIDSTVNYIEHPQVVCNRILEAVAAVGDKERVIAGVDCGFGTFAGWEMVAQSVVWAKLSAQAEGAKLASKQLW